MYELTLLAFFGFFFLVCLPLGFALAPKPVDYRSITRGISKKMKLWEEVIVAEIYPCSLISEYGGVKSPFVPVFVDLDICPIDHNGKIPYTWDCCEVIFYSNRSYPKGSIGALLSVHTFMDGDVYPRVHYEVGYWSGSEAISCCQDGYAVCCETSNVNVVEFLFPVLYRAMLAEAKEMRIASRRRTQRAYEQDEFVSRPYCAKARMERKQDRRDRVLNTARRQARATVAQAKGR